MKKIFYVFVVCIIPLFSIDISAQVAESIKVRDTRDISESPGFFKQEIRADLKQLSTSGISTAYGFSTNLTISPWFDGSAGFIHQLNFNDSGLYYRNGDASQASWNSWKKIVLSDLDGNVGIGTLDTQGYKLAVNGTIRAKEIKVDSEWADFVFKKGYNLLTLEEVENHINEKGILPGIPTEEKVKANGVNLGEMNVLLLQKVEELTLYIIQLEKRIKAMEAK